MANALMIGLSGGLGALSRYWVDGLITRRFSGAFPYGTFLVNISGAFLLGFAFTMMNERFAVTPQVRSAITVGFLGAYTTFSTLTLQTLRLIADDAYFLALLNAIGSLAIGLLSVWLGIVLGKAV